MNDTNRPASYLLAAAGVLMLASGCATTLPGSGEASPERLIAVTTGNQLVEFVAGRPERIVARRPLSGIQPGERIVGMDFRPSNGRLYAVGNAGQLYTIDLSSGIAERVGVGRYRTLATGDLGVDFIPDGDRLRVVNARGDSFRVDPDTGAVIDADTAAEGIQVDGAPAYATRDRNAGRTPRLAGLAHTNSHAAATMATAYAIDAANGMLVTLGSGEGAASPVAANTGQLSSVGPLGFDLGQGPVAFDIGPANVALMTMTIPAGRSELYRVNLMNGSAGRIGRIGIGETVTAIAIVPVAARPGPSGETRTP